MAQYQIGNQVYELPDNLPPQQLQQIPSQLAAGQIHKAPAMGPLLIVSTAHSA